MKTKSLYGHTPELEPFAGKSPSEQVAALQSWGCNAIFGGYQNPTFVESAHAVGMKVFAEFGCFVGQRWWDSIPSSRPVLIDGTPLEPEGWYYGVNPSLPEIREKQLQELESTLKRYSLDGIWFDFIRWPSHWEVKAPFLPQTSFDAATLDRFATDAGLDIPNGIPARATETILSRHRHTWNAWRCDQITSWVASASDIVRSTSPGTILGLFGVPWRSTDYSGAIVDVVGQDYAALAEYVGVFSPMVYHAMCGFPVQWIGDVVKDIRALCDKAVWPIIQSVDEPAPLPVGEYASALELALNHPSADGVIVFNQKGVLDSGKLDVTKALFSR